MKQSALKQDAEVIQPTDQMQKIHGPLDSKLPGGLQAAQAVFSDCTEHKDGQWKCGGAQQRKRNVVACRGPCGQEAEAGDIATAVVHGLPVK